MRVVEIDVDATYELRWRVLRDSQPGSDVRFPEDDVAGALHLGTVDDDHVLVAVASFSPGSTPHRPRARAMRLRGLAVEPGRQGAGAGRMLIDAAVERLRAQDYEVLWANARDSVLGFYRRLGWRVLEGGFSHAGIPHHVVLVEI